jgi:hypothetical protein
MQCPVCNTDNQTGPRCKQCDSDLEVFSMVEKIGTRLDRPNRLFGRFLWFVGAGTGIVVIGGIIGMVWQVQLLTTNLLDEVRSSRATREALEERNAKLTEKLFESATGSTSSMLTMLTEANRDQSASIQQLNQQIHELLLREEVARHPARKTQKSIDASK